ncbi:hypothetical protein [Microseira wollei]|nr:hypothetical protein [Microseira wollei]
MTKTQQEIVRQGYQALVDALGIVDTIRFIQHFSSGQGDYTQERHVWLDGTSLQDILTLLPSHPKNLYLMNREDAKNAKEEEGRST